MSELKVGIIMGSDSDLQVMRHVGRALTLLGMTHGQEYEEGIVSAHRTPDWMTEYATTAEERGLQVIVAGAGGSAHLPGMVASETALPVLGVAITDSPDVLNTALGSMIRMPEGKPLGTLQGKSGAFNAGLLAARILALSDPELRRNYYEYEQGLEETVLVKHAKLAAIGAEQYLAELEK